MKRPPYLLKVLAGAVVFVAFITLSYGIATAVRDKENARAIRYTVGQHVSFSKRATSLLHIINIDVEDIVTINDPNGISGKWVVTKVNYSADLVNTTITDRLKEIDSDLAQAVLSNAINETPITYELRLKSTGADIFVYKKNGKFVKPDANRATYQIPSELIDVKSVNGKIRAYDKVTNIEYDVKDTNASEITQAIADRKPLTVYRYTTRNPMSIKINVKK